VSIFQTTDNPAKWNRKGGGRTHWHSLLQLKHLKHQSPLTLNLWSFWFSAFRLGLRVIPPAFLHSSLLLVYQGTSQLPLSPEPGFQINVLFICLSIYLSIYLPIYPSIYLSFLLVLFLWRTLINIPRSYSLHHMHWYILSAMYNTSQLHRTHLLLCTYIHDDCILSSPFHIFYFILHNQLKKKTELLHRKGLTAV
jgi:hypothetical protein